MLRINGNHLIVYETVVRVSVWEADLCIVHRCGDDGRVINNAACPYQRAVIGIADRARICDAGGKRFFLRASLDLPVWTEVYEAGFEEERPVVAKRGRPCGIASVMQFLREVHAQALRFFFVASIEDDVPYRLQTKTSVHRPLEQWQRDCSSVRTGGNIDMGQPFDRYVELA